MSFVSRALLPGLVVSAVILSACSPNSMPASTKPPASSTRQPVSRCAGDDVELDVLTLGWAFCHPKGWSIVQRSIATSNPQGVDTTLDVVAGDGFFGFMIVGSYQRGNAASLNDWLAANAPDDTQVEPIAWANASQAVSVKGQLKRYAMTSHRVYALTLREGAGNLDLEAAMQPRLSSWSFII